MFRYSLKEILAGVFGLATLLVILEHAGGFSNIIGASSKAFATGYQSLTGHTGGRAGVATGAK